MKLFFRNTQIYKHTNTIITQVQNYSNPQYAHTLTRQFVLFWTIFSNIWKLLSYTSGTFIDVHELFKK